MDFWTLAAAGRAYFLLGEPLLAAKYLKTAVLLRPDYTDLYYYLAQACADKRVGEKCHLLFDLWGEGSETTAVPSHSMKQ